MAKIGIDGRFWGIEHTGIGRYLMELVRNLEKVDHENKYLIFLRKKYYHRINFTNKNFSKVLADFPHYSISEQFKFKKILENEKLDLVHFPHFNLPISYQGKFIVTIHDLIKHESKGLLTTTQPSFLYWIKYMAYLLVVNLALRRAQAVIVPSFWWQRRLTKKFKLMENKVKVTYESVSEVFKKDYSNLGSEKFTQILSKYGLKSPFVIYTGNLYPHKNVHRLVEAIKMINEKRKLYLVIVCAKSLFWQRFKADIDKINITDRIILAGFVPDQDLALIYNLAEAFVFPSLLEGFGLPGLEAMACGLPVIAARASCLPEIYKNAAIYFNPKKSQDIKRKILSLLDNQSERTNLINLGKERILNFSWLKMAEKTLKIYNEVLRE